MKRDLPKLIKSQISKGFTLIELLVVIAILGVLAVVLITVIDPLDKIRSGNDAGLISTVTQLGKANDAYAAGHANAYSSGQGTFPASVCTGGGATAAVATNSFAGAVYDLCASGESKQSSVTVPSSVYTFYYFVSPTGCTDNANNCTGNLFAVGPLQSKKYASKRYFMWTNGYGCFINSAPTQASIGTSGASCL